MKHIVLASHNPDKIREFEPLLAPLGLEVVSAADLGLASPRELTGAEGATFTSNAKLKAETACAASGHWALADDSGICVDMLDGAPGVDTADFGGWQALLQAMSTTEDAAWGGSDRPDGPENGPHYDKKPQRTAQFVCVLALARPGLETLLFSGVVPGHIATEGRGDNGFDYDPVFVPEGETRSYAEMSDADKATSSHRARAVALLVDWLTSPDGRTALGAL